MAHMQECLSRAANELGVRIVTNYVAVLSNGSKVSAQALFPDFGGAFGTLVFDSSVALDAAIRRDLLGQGYTISTFSQPLPNEEFDVDGYMEMFSEWGWTSNGRQKPTWLP